MKRFDWHHIGQILFFLAGCTFAGIAYFLKRPEGVDLQAYMTPWALATLAFAWTFLRNLPKSTSDADAFRAGAGGRGGQSGQARMGVILLLAAVGSSLLVALGAALLAACVPGPNGGPPTVSPTVATDVTAGANAALCVFQHYTADVSAKMQPAAIVADCVMSCGLPAAQVTGLLDAHQAAESAEMRAISK